MIILSFKSVKGLSLREIERISVSRPAEGFLVNEILRARSVLDLRQAVQEAQRSKFLQLLCKKQKEGKKPPTACFELKQPANRHCLYLKTEDLDVPILNQALSSDFLSPLCRKHLEEKKKILLYRKKDQLIFRNKTLSYSQ